MCELKVCQAESEKRREERRGWIKIVKMTGDRGRDKHHGIDSDWFAACLGIILQTLEHSMSQRHEFNEIHEQAQHTREAIMSNTGITSV